MDQRPKIEVEAESVDLRLDIYLAEALGSRSAAQRAIEAGSVLVNGGPVAKRYRVQLGDVIAIEAPADIPIVQSSRSDLSVAYEDESLFVINKPAGLVVHPAPGHRGETLAEILDGSTAGGEPGRSGIVHRLDRDTSGLIIVARSEESHRLLSSAIQSRDVEREYSALVIGHPETDEGTIDAPIGRDIRVRTKMSIATDKPREAVTHFRLVEALPDSALLTVRLETGRTHQIRVHLAAIGLPVAGDPTYGVESAFGLKRQFLHAQRLAFDHPITGERIDVSSDLPDDLVLALTLARASRVE